MNKTDKNLALKSYKRADKSRNRVDLMEEKERVCILCFRKEVMSGYICSTCQERIQREIMNQRNEMREDAERVIREYDMSHKKGLD